MFLIDMFQHLANVQAMLSHEIYGAYSGHNGELGC